MDDQPHGIVRSWHPNGIPRAEYRYEHGVLSDARAWSDSGMALPGTEAERLAVDARAMLEAGPWRERSPMASALNCLGEIYLRQGKLAEAEPVFRQSLSAWAKATTKETSYTVGPLRNLAQIHFQRQEYGPARDLLNRAQVLVEEIHGADHPSLAGIFNQQAAIYRVEGNGAKAESL